MTLASLLADEPALGPALKEPALLTLWGEPLNLLPLTGAQLAPWKEGQVGERSTTGLLGLQPAAAPAPGRQCPSGSPWSGRGAPAT